MVILKGYLAPSKPDERWRAVQMRAMIDSGAEADFISPSALARTGTRAEEGHFGTVVEAFGKESPITRRALNITVVLPGRHPGAQKAVEARHQGELLVAPADLSMEYDLILGQPFLNARSALWQFGDRRWLQVQNADGAPIQLRPPDDEEPDDSPDILARALGRRSALQTRAESSVLIASMARDHRCDGMQAVLEDAEAEKTRRAEEHAQRMLLAERAAKERPDLVMSLEDWESMAHDGKSVPGAQFVLQKVCRPAQPAASVAVSSLGMAPGAPGPGEHERGDEESEATLGELPAAEREEAEGRRARLIAEFKDVFPDVLPHIDHISPAINGGVQIKTVEGAQAAGRYGARMTPADTEKTRGMIDELLALGFIRPSDSDWGAPMFLVDKPDGGKRMVIDYRALNSKTIRNRYPLPRVDELFDLLSGARYFSKIDLRTGYWQIRMAPESVSKTAFTSRHGHFEWLVLPMGLTNAPAEFMKMMEDTFRDQLNKSILVFLDDILVFSKTLEEHEQHLRAALQKLRAKKLYGKLSKCTFFRSEVEFLGHHVGRAGVRMVEDKVTAVEQWPTPRTQKEVERFIGLAGFYRKFIAHFSRISAPLTELCGTRKKGAGPAGRAPPAKPFKWEAAQQKAFEDLKRAVISAPCLAMPDMEREFVVHTDASGYATGAVLMQKFDEGLRPIAFLSKKMRAAERRYPVHEQELLAILNALKAWRHYLSGRRFTVWMDHQSLQYIESSQMATPRQQRWSAWLGEFDFSVRYTPGEKNVVADALSRADQRPEEDLEPQLLLSALADAGPLPVRIKEAARDDPSYQALLRLPRAHLARKKMERDGDLLYRQSGAFVVPSAPELRTWIMAWAHDVVSSAHRGSGRMIEWIKERAWWSKMDADVQQYCRSCDQCQRSKPDQQGRKGLPLSVETPRAVGDWLSMDFVGPFPNGGSGATAVMVVVERLSRYVFFVPCRTTSSARDVWQLLNTHVLTHTGVPRAIVSDRDTRFTSHFWEGLWSQMGTELKRSTAFHPQTDGQAERAVRTLVEALRTVIDATHENWEELLPHVARAFNSSVCESTKKTPEEIFLGGRRRTLLDSELEQGGVRAPASHPGAQEQSERVRQAIQDAQSAIEKAQQKQRDDAAKGRRAPDIKVGDLVWLSREHLRPVRRNADRARKLDPIYSGPFPVARMAGTNAAELTLPPGWKLHPVFNLDLMKKHVPGEDLFPARPVDDDRRGPVDDDLEEDPGAGGPASVKPADDIFEVESILSERAVRGGKQFLVKWAGWPRDQASWVSEADCAGAPEVIADYFRRVARQPAPKRGARRRVLALSVDWARNEHSELYLCGAAARRIDPSFKPGGGPGQPALGSAEAKARETSWKNTMWNRVVPPGVARPVPNKDGEVNMGARRCAADTKAGGWCKARTRYGCLCWIHRAQLNGTQIKDSTLQGAGKGLFARTDFAKGDAIVRYTGDVVDTVDGAQEDGWRGSSYVLEVTNSWGIDAARTDTADGRMINDTVASDKRANVTFAFDARRKVVTVRAMRAIKAGEELFIKYGGQYWAREAVGGPGRRQQPAPAPPAPVVARPPPGPTGSKEDPIALDSLARRVFSLGMLSLTGDVQRGRWRRRAGRGTPWIWVCGCGAARDESIRDASNPSCYYCGLERPEDDPPDDDEEMVVARDGMIQEVRDDDDTRRVVHQGAQRLRAAGPRGGRSLLQVGASAARQGAAASIAVGAAVGEVASAVADIARAGAGVAAGGAAILAHNAASGAAMGVMNAAAGVVGAAAAVMAHLSPVPGAHGLGAHSPPPGAMDEVVGAREDDGRPGQGAPDDDWNQMVRDAEEAEEKGMGPPRNPPPPPPATQMDMRRAYIGARPNRQDLIVREARWETAARSLGPAPLPRVAWGERGIHQGPPAHLQQGEDCRGLSAHLVPLSVAAQNKVFRDPERRAGMCRRDTCECCAPVPARGYTDEAGRQLYLPQHWCSCAAVVEGLCRRCWLDLHGPKEKFPNQYWGPPNAPPPPADLV